MYTYNVEVLVQNQEDFGTSTRTYQYQSQHYPEAMEEQGNYEHLWDSMETIAQSQDRVLLEILDYYLVDAE